MIFSEQAVAHQPASHRRDFRAGFVAMLPLWLGAAPFGVIYAVTALEAGLTPLQTLAMSLLVFAGASQFTAAGLFASGVAPLTIVITTLIINLRHVLLAASLAPYLRRAPAWFKALLAFQITDESYAVGTRAFLDGSGSPAYQFGANMSMYVIWPISTALGIALGSFLPDTAAYGLDLVFPLTFIALLVPLLRERVSVLVAVVAGVLTLGGALLLPGKWYILLAGIVASGVGAWLARTDERVTR
ncbi:MAG TPA: AzlC family ABC transporter permease [Roseiflexaceae bacterium]|jgi:4-azaleucine resistance transporter AzlC|nr:AzlC family ABC transporter permease [Roseiflexaceae bacterium]